MRSTNIKSAPFLHDYETAINLHLDLIIGLVSALIIATVQNGFRVLSVCLFSAAASFVTEMLGNLIKKKHFCNDIRSIAIGLIIAMLCPVTVPVWLPALASSVSVLLVRVILGDNYKKLFITSVIGWLFLLSFFPKYMTIFPSIRFFGNFPVFGEATNFQSTYSIAQLLQFNNTPPYSFMDLLTGSYPGGMGTTCIFVIFVVCIYFIFRKSMAWQVSLSMIITVALFAVIFNRTDTSVIFSILYELTSNSYIFVAVFIAGDIITAPMITGAKVAYGFLAGIFTMIFRYIGMAEHSLVVSMFIVTFLAEPLDLIALKLKNNKIQKK